MRRSHQIMIVVPTLLALAGVLAGQAMIEHGIASGGAGIGAASSRNVSKSVSGITNKLDQVLQTGGPGALAPNDRGTSASTRPMQFTKVPAFDSYEPGRKYEDPKAIQKGIANDELIRRFGPPALQITGVPAGRCWTYSHKESVVQLDVNGEKVSAVDSMNPRQAAVVLPIGHGFQTYR
jgi:hypothetical protein